jgi:hypothetical protein
VRKELNRTLLSIVHIATDVELIEEAETLDAK